MCVAAVMKQTTKRELRTRTSDSVGLYTSKKKNPKKKRLKPKCCKVFISKNKLHVFTDDAPCYFVPQCQPIHLNPVLILFITCKGY